MVEVVAIEHAGWPASMAFTITDRDTLQIHIVDVNQYLEPQSDLLAPLFLVELQLWPWNSAAAFASLQQRLTETPGRGDDERC